VQGKSKRKSLIAIALLLALAYGVSDEFHQLFVRGRNCSLSDFLIDSAGIYLACFLYTVSLSLRRQGKFINLSLHNNSMIKRGLKLVFLFLLIVIISINISTNLTYGQVPAPRPNSVENNSLGYIIEFRNPSLSEKNYDLKEGIKNLEAKKLSIQKFGGSGVQQIQTQISREESKNLRQLSDYKNTLRAEHKSALNDINLRLSKTGLPTVSYLKGAFNIGGLLEFPDTFFKLTGLAVSRETSLLVPKREFYNVFNGVSLKISAQEAESIRQSGYVKGVYPNLEVQVTLMDSVPLINADDVWEIKDSQGQNLTGANITIGIIDTGIDYTHPDLGGCFGPGCKVIGGWDFVHNDSDPIDDHGHGTHCAGIAVGSGEGGLKGVSPDAKLYAYKALSSVGTGSSDNIIAAIDRSVDPNQDGDFSDHLDVISLSIGRNCGGSYSESCGPDDSLSTAIDNVVESGVVAVVAAGNSGPNASTIWTPGTARNAITVGASYKKDYNGTYSRDYNPRIDQLTSFSSRGPVNIGNETIIKPDIVAPGAIICSSRYDSAWNGSECLDQKHVQISGTSMATPHIAGAVAIIKQTNSSYSPKEIKDLLKNTSVDLGYDPNAQGAGRVDVLSAIQYLSGEINLTIIGAIYVTSIPSGAYVYVDDILKGTTPRVISKISPGEHTIKFVLANYGNTTQNVTVIADKTINVSAVLEPLTGNIYATSIPSSASFYLDNSYNGITPLTLNGVSPGKHSVKFALTNYADNSQDVTVIAGSTMNISVNLTSIYGSLYATSIPSGAYVYLDNSYKGTTPLTLPGISSGVHSIRFVLANYADFNQNITILSGKALNVSANLTLLTGNIYASSMPSGSSVYVDNILKGTTPILVSGVPIGTRSVRFTLNDYSEVNKSVSVLTDKTVNVSVNLTLLPGGIYATSNPSGAYFYLDNSYKGITPLTITGIPSGIHSANFVLSNYISVSQNITIPIGKRINVSTNLTSIYGSISATSIPSRAYVYLDNSYKGTTPLTLPGISSGVHSIRFVLANYADFNQNITILSGKALNVSANLTLLTGNIYASSMPSGSSVYVDNILKGTTPILVSGVPIGTRSVRFTLNDYSEVNKSVSVLTDKTVNVSVNLTLLPGGIYATSNPSGAYFYLDNSYKGITPLTITGIPSGIHSANFVLSNYISVSQNITIPIGKRINVSTNLTSIYGSISATSIPSRAYVYLDNSYKILSPGLITGINSGIHQIKFILTGYKTDQRNISVISGKTTNVSVILSKL
jgi:subtilisin family serine protease